MSNSQRVEASSRRVEETSRLLAAILARPLSQQDRRQLARPSFKFIHELVCSVAAETRTLRDAFNANELQRRNWDRRAKVEFVQRLIDYVAANQQPVANCAASRVVAGLEPDKTNELLQALARVVRAKLSSRRGRAQTFTRAPVPVGKQPVAGSSSKSGDNETPALERESALPAGESPALGAASRLEAETSSGQKELEPTGKSQAPSENDRAKGIQLVRERLAQLRLLMGQLSKVNESLEESVACLKCS